MGELNRLVEKYMLLDKKTLAELLALKEMEEKDKNLTLTPDIQPGTVPPYIPTYPYNPSYPYNPNVPYTPTPTWPGDWTITCHLEK